jgi:hypothetical protein
MRAMSRSSNAFHDSSMRAFRRCSIASRCCLSSLSKRLPVLPSLTQTAAHPYPLLRPKAAT